MVSPCPRLPGLPGTCAVLLLGLWAAVHTLAEFCWAQSVAHQKTVREPRSIQPCNMATHTHTPHLTPHPSHTLL